MPRNIHAVIRKRKELAAIAAQAELNANQLEKLLQAFVRLTAPVEEREDEPGDDDCFGYITILPSFTSARSRKPGNLFLNWKKLFEVVPDVALAGFGAAGASVLTIPWVVPLAGLYIWNKVLVGSTESLTEKDACILHALWENRDGNNKIAEPAGLIHVNNLRTQHGMLGLSQAEYTKALTNLAKIRCVELDNGVVWMCESVKVEWS